MNLYKYCTFFFLFFVFLSNLFPQVNTDWIRRHNGSGNSFDIVTTMFTDGNNIFVSGNSTNLNTLQDITLIKYSSNGDVVFTSSYNGALNLSDNANSACIFENNSVYIAGNTTNSSGNTSGLILKFDTSGVNLWQYVFSDTAYFSSNAIDVKNDSDGNIFSLISARKSDGRNNFFILKINISGKVVWKREYSAGSMSIEPNSLAVLNNECYIAATSRKSLSSQSDIKIIKYSSSGDHAWTRDFAGAAGNDDRPVKIITAENNIAVTGVSYSPASHFDVVTLLFSSAGNLLWQRTFNGTGSSLDYPYDMISDYSGNIFITGSTRSDTLLGSERMMLLKYNSSGNLSLQTSYGSNNGAAIGFSIALDSESNIYLGGSSDRGNNQMEYATVKFSSSGNFLWVKNYSASQTPEDFIYKILVSNSNDVFVTGISFDSNTDYDFTTIKYSQSTDIEPAGTNIPSEYFLYQNYPNPFNPSTKIKFSIPVSSNVSLKLYDVAGRFIMNLVNGFYSAGIFEIDLNGEELSSGTYFYTLESKNFRQTRKMVVLK